MKPSGVRVANTSDVLGVVVASGNVASPVLPLTGIFAGRAAGLPAVTLFPGGILFCARTISGRLFPRPATCRTACVTVGSGGQELILKIAQSPVPGVVRSAFRLPKSAPLPPPAEAGPTPPIHR